MTLRKGRFAGALAWILLFVSARTSALAASLPPGVTRTGGVDGHLYVAGGSGSSMFVERFPLVNGVPRAKPDRTYPGVGAPIAVDSAGNLYASDSSYQGTISVFPPQANRPPRTINIGYGSNYYYVSNLGALTTDSLGYLYVVYISTTRYGDSSYSFVNIYAPGAQGDAYPVDVLELQGNEAASAQGVAIDGSGTLLADSDAEGSGPPAIFEFANPTSRNPTVLGRLSGTGISSSGLAFSAATGYVYCNVPGAMPFVSVILPVASVLTLPAFSIEIDGAQSFGPGIAVFGSNLFVADPVANEVYEVSALGAGVHMPHFSIGVPQPEDVKVGP